ncbi:hypothetical protein FH972_021420 [Carpinus fangiana]|uniref:Coenzyme Q-binding protein COQ10 START domain-containing protein n=1 Tax=Carpinus fangiana TaxID=176857 RepID=A0A5N6KPN1_9ROSI|nr:hypothetical protein FH972_021420 [Carpinus fangiana]
MAVRTLRPVALRSLEQPTSLFTKSSTLKPHTQHARRHLNHQQTRTFLPDLSALAPGPQTLTASRILPYPAYPIFSIIADISSYPVFLPLMTDATVTSLSNPDAHYQRRWPQEAVLTVGLRDISQSFTSRITCVPPVPDAAGRAGVGVVESVSGAHATLSTMAMVEGDTAHHTHEQLPALGNGGPLALLRARWQVREYPHKPAPTEGERADGASADAVARSEVSLSIEYKFSSPMYDVMSRAATPKIAESVVAAFEARVRKLLSGERESIGT